jgi:hypothetical protein
MKPRFRHEVLIVLTVLLVAIMGEYYREEVVIANLERDLNRSVRGLMFAHDPDSCRAFNEGPKFTFLNTSLPLESKRQEAIFNRIERIEREYCSR